MSTRDSYTRQIMGCHLSEWTRVRNAFDDVAGNICLGQLHPPSHRMPFISMKEASKCVGRRGGQCLPGLLHSPSHRTPFILMNEGWVRNASDDVAAISAWLWAAAREAYRLAVSKHPQDVRARLGRVVQAYSNKPRVETPMGSVPETII